MNSDAQEQTPSRRVRLRFSLRTCLLVILLIATYWAGWVSHRLFHNRNLDENIKAALEQIDNQDVQVDNREDLGITIVRGKKESVEATTEAIDRVREAAGE